MPPWISYALLAVLLLLPVLFAFIGDEPPDNAIRHESGDSQPGEDQDDAALVLKAA